MRKHILKIIVIIFLFIPGVNVFAAHSSNHISLVEEIKFEGQYLYIGGYAFLSHRDNYGVKGGMGNLKNYIVAYKINSGATNDPWNINMINNDGSCTDWNDVPCYSQQLKWSTDVRDLYYARCANYGCSKASYNRTTNVTAGYSFSTTCDGYTEGGVVQSNCIYYNVGYKDSINIRNLVQKLFGTDGFDSSNGSIGFKVVSIIKNSDNTYTKGYSDLGINKYVCKNEDGSFCENNETNKLENGLYSIEMTGSSTSAIFDAERAQGRVFNNYNFETAAEIDGAIPYFLTGAEFDINEGRMLDIDKGIGNFSDYVFQLESKILSAKNGTNITIQGGAFKKIIAPSGITSSNFDSGKYKDTDLYKEENNGVKYWALGNWLIIKDSLKITKFKVNSEKIRCTDIAKGSGNRLESREANSSCDEDNSANAEFFQCKEYHGGDAISTEIYLYLGNNPQCKGEYFQGPDGNYYLRVPITSEFIIEQIGEFHFANFTPNSVRAGKGFTINNIENGISYFNEVRWVFGSKMKIDDDASENLKKLYHNAPYIAWEPQNKLKQVVADGETKCVNDESFDFIKELNEGFKEINDDGSIPGKFYYLSADGTTMVHANFLNVAFNAIDIKIMDTYFSSYKDIRKDTSYDSGVGIDENNIKFNSCDSNSSSTSCKHYNNDNKGIGKWVTKETIGYNGLGVSGFTSTDNVERYFIKGEVLDPSGAKFSNRGYGARRFVLFEYSLPKAYVSLISDNYNYGDIIYSNNIINDSSLYGVGNKYFIPLKYSGSSFPFNLAPNINPSFISDMEWELNGTCNVGVQNGLFDDGGKPLYRYRSIALDNPFPKGNTTLNWQSLIIKTGNYSRLRNTFENISSPLYSVRLTKIDGIEDTITLDKVNRCSTDGTCGRSYGTLDGLESNGESNFLKDNGISASVSHSYCGLGLFSSKCDAYPNGEIIDEGFGPIGGELPGGPIELPIQPIVPGPIPSVS